MNKQLLIQGALYVIIGALTPVIAMLSSDRELDNRAMLTVVIAGIVAGATALKAFLSTTFAQTKESELPNPPLAYRYHDERRELRRK